MEYQKTLEKWMNNMNCLPLPRELQIKIMEYDVNHRKNFKLTLERIRAKAAVRITNNVIDRWCKQRYGLNPIGQLEYINIHVPDKECMFNALKTCKCCKRHQTNRPVFGEYPAYDSYCQDTYLCDCRCRQNMRILSRARFLETEGREPDPRLGRLSQNLSFPHRLRLFSLFTETLTLHALLCMASHRFELMKTRVRWNYQTVNGYLMTLIGYSLRMDWTPKIVQLLLVILSLGLVM